MFTNGLTHWLEYIPEAEVNSPYLVQGFSLSASGEYLVVEYCHQQNKNFKSRRVFKRQENGEFITYNPEIGEDSFYGRYFFFGGDEFILIKLDTINHPMLKQAVNITIEKKPRGEIVITLPELIA